MAEQIVVGVDGSANGLAALRWAAAHAQPDDTICLVNAWSASAAAVHKGSARPDDEAAAKALLRREAARVRALGPRKGVEITTTAVPGDPRHALLESVRDADLLVIGARGHSRIVDLLMGSTSSFLTSHAPCPTVVVPCPVASHDSQ